jgi:hypothetical protein
VNTDEIIEIEMRCKIIADRVESREGFRSLR